MKTINEIVEDLKSLDVTELLEIHNEYCEENKYYEDIFYHTGEEFFELFYNGSLVDFTRSVLNGTVDLDESYIKSDVYGQLRTFRGSEIVDELDLHELADFVSEKPELLEKYIGE